MSPSFQGIDRAVAPPPATAKKMLDTIDGRWWNVYIGGPESGGHGWSPSVVREYARHGIDRFMLTYVGRQWDGPLTRAQGQADARDALAIAKSYGYTGDFPLCLDVELRTFNTSASKTVEYTRAWCATVREAGARPGVYANPAPLIAMAKGKVPADFVWVASWVSTSASPRDPHDAKGMPVHLWGKRGQRAWQYAGIIGGRPCNILGLNVDINVADLGCLAPPPGGVAGPAHRPQRPRPLRRGDQGATVVRLTHRLSVLSSRRTGHPYLDGPRKRFDAETEAALKAFQTEHGVAASGTYGKPSAIALLKAVRRAKEQKQLAHQGASIGGNGATAGIEPTRLPALVKEFRRLDDAADRAWQRIEAYGRKRRRLVAHAKDAADGEVTLADVTASLARIEKQLATIVELERREVAVAEEPVATAEAVAAYGGPAATGPAYPASTTQPGPPAGTGAAGSNGAASNGEPPRRSLAALSDVELDRRIDRLDRRLDEARKARVARYARVDKVLAGLTGPHPVKPVPKPGGVKPKPGVVKPKPGGVKPKPGGVKPKPGVMPKPDRVVTDKVRSLQRNLNRFAERYLEGIPPIAVDGKKGPETDKRIRTAKYYLGYGGDERTSASVPPAFLRRLLHPHSARASGPAMLARAAQRRKKQRKRAQRVGAGPIEGSPKHIIDAIVLPICRSCGIARTTADNDAANAAHGATVTGSLSDHQGPPTRAWAADMSNGGSPTPEMDKLARELAKRFDIPWTGAGLRNATHSGYRFQVIYRTNIGGNHFNHVHFGVKDV
jgi:peptidoglycan hydrolase-like protein with peptidoglycan-binding domain